MYRLKTKMTALEMFLPMIYFKHFGRALRLEEFEWRFFS